MASSKQLINSLLTEHFRYTPLTLVDELINTVNEVVYRAISALEEGLLAASPPELGFAEPVGAAVEIEEGVHKLETLLGAVVDRNFDKTEIYVLRNILSVPEELVRWVRVGGYENLDFTPDASAPTSASLFALRRKAHETQRLQRALEHEAQRNATVMAEMQTFLHGAGASTGTTAGQTPAGGQDVAFLTQTPGAQSLGVSFARAAATEGTDGAPLVRHSAAAIAQLPALKAQLARLRPLLDARVSLPGPSAAADERRDHIEAQARKQLERQGVNVDTGDGLVGPSGVAGGLGMGMGRDEVGSIEGVVDALQKGRDVESKTEE